MNTKKQSFAERHGKPYIAFLTSVAAWASVFVSVYLRAFVFHTLDVGTILAASGILTGAATAYAAGAAYVKGREYED